MKQRKITHPAPFVVIPTPRRKRRAHLTLPEYRALLSTAKQRGEFEHLTIRLLYEHGLRSCEVGRLRLDYCKLLAAEGRFYLPRGKGSVQTWVYTSQETQQLLLAWIERTYPHEATRKPSAFVFPSVQPRRLGAARNEGVSRKTVYAMVKDLAAEAGLDSGLVTPHALKRSRGQHMFEEAQKMGMAPDVTLKSIAKVLGHGAAKTSWQYYMDETDQGKELAKRTLALATEGT